MSLRHWSEFVVALAVGASLVFTLVDGPLLHRLDLPSGEADQAIGVRWRGPHLHRLTGLVEDVEVEAFAARRPVYFQAMPFQRCRSGRSKKVPRLL